MTNVPVVCANCGAKYRIPASFQKDSAKCKACGGTIDVRSQLDAAASGASTGSRPAKAAKAPAKSASANAAKDRSKPSAAKSARTGSSRRRSAVSEDDAQPTKGGPARGGARGRGRSARGSGDDAGEGRGSRRGGRGEREEKKSNPAVLYGSIVGLVAIVAVVLVFMLREDEPTKKDTAQDQTAQDQSGAKTDGDTGGATPDENAPELSEDDKKSIALLESVKGELEAADQAKVDELIAAAKANPQDVQSHLAKLTEMSSDGMVKLLVSASKAADVPADQVAVIEQMAGNPAMADSVKQMLNAAFSGGAAAAKPAAAKKSDTAKAQPRKKGQPLTSKDQVFDPKTLPKLEYPDYVDAKLEAELDDLAEAVKYSDFAGQKALEKLVAKGHAGIVPLVNALRELDYFDASDTRVAFSIHKRLKSLSGGNLTNFELPASEEISLDVAHKNARGARGWQTIWNAYSDKEKWEKMMSDYAKKQRKKQ